MIAVILLLCVVGGLAIYRWVVRPFIVPLSSRIATGREYRATLIHTRRKT